MKEKYTSSLEELPHSNLRIIIPLFLLVYVVTNTFAFHGMESYDSGTCIATVIIDDQEYSLKVYFTPDEYIEDYGEEQHRHIHFLRLNDIDPVEGYECIYLPDEIEENEEYEIGLRDENGNEEETTLIIPEFSSNNICYNYKFDIMNFIVLTFAFGSALIYFIACIYRIAKNKVLI